ncbi:MAG: thioredoxin family protein [Hyphomonadaceae bacterium]|nr:thioredoxin family protein [Hyphomonadaceae bacterium]
MQRLNDDTLDAFLEGAGTAILLFGAPSGGPTFHQAEELAALWAERPGDARFGHVDATCNDLARRDFDIRLLPTTIVLRNGAPVARFEGVQPRWRIEAALNGATLPEALAA